MFFTSLSSWVRSQGIQAEGSIMAQSFITDATRSNELLTLQSVFPYQNLIVFKGTAFNTANARIGFNSNYSLLIKNYNTGSSDLVILEGGNGGRFWMYPDGKLYANNLGDIGSHRDMHWNQTTGEIGWTSSSARYKTNISGMEEDWTKILQISPVRYTRPDSPNYWEYGYLAEDLDATGLQPLVGYSAEGEPDYIHYDKIVLYLTEMLKIHQAEITELRQSIDKLKTGKKPSRKKRH